MVAAASGLGWHWLAHKSYERLMAWWPEEGRRTEGRKGEGTVTAERTWWAVWEACSLGL